MRRSVGHEASSSAEESLGAATVDSRPDCRPHVGPLSSLFTPGVDGRIGTGSPSATHAPWSLWTDLRVS